MRARGWWIAGLVIAVLVTAGVFAFTGGDNPLVGPGGGLRDAGAATGVDPRGGVAIAPAVTDQLKLPTEIAAKVESGGAASLAPEELTEYERYLAETAAVVQSNAASLENIVVVTVDALVDDDIASLTTLWAPDEEVDTSHIAAVAKAYPEMVAGEFQRTVKVGAVEDATVYFAYAVVEWTDAGVTSTHTIEVPVRFVDGQWHLTSIGSNTAGLSRVHSVRLP